MSLETTLKDPNRLLAKVAYLTWYKGISQRNDHAWMVDGITGTHMVEVLTSGRITCDCKGYEIRGVCSHVMAVAMIIEEGRLAKPEAPGRPRKIAAARDWSAKAWETKSFPPVSLSLNTLRDRKSRDSRQPSGADINRRR